ncbi:hypothetical protein OPW41_05745 [Vibrio europaeus]|uniref:Lipoprotein n=1 Tax=Vibrio europaeus TaxID=300876 RepID=A0A178J8W7_9VIBR|nr:hypothetical protein [Vibrio europaeus]MDC5705370.1 hypothetical protein [Vibrio europaeus]MDC5710649.1 hypothetical protein [Vibrio europaeus]MDC5715739.1 hypothetical protein [Vibrio europaeus]MDC5719900.1 hypothetical protein [Vibrio europaeus]MDC5724212.1 hypothetical protein [Vibrio europaeus]
MNNKLIATALISGSLSLFGCSSTGDIENEADKSHDALIADWVDSQILAPEGLSLTTDNLKYLSGKADLNNDGNPEYFVLIRDPYFCGSGGCSATIFSNTGNIITDMTVTDTPILLADSYRNGWRDFIVWSNGAYRLMSFNGESYPSNPSVEPVADLESQRQSAKEKVMAIELYQQDGYDIKAVYDAKIWAPAEEFHFTFKHYGDPDFTYHAKVNQTTGEVDVHTEPVK